MTHEENKKTRRLVIVGHVDHGKSTLIGRLLLETHSLPTEKISEIERISRELGKDAELAYLTDSLQEERELNITIDTTQVFFSTPNFQYVIIDTPGHKEFIRNTMTGVGQADCAVIIVDASDGIQEQTKRHAYLLSLLGIRQIIVAINKMDLIDYQEDKYRSVVQHVSSFLDELSLTPNAVVPISAREGVNITDKGSALSWYNGPTMLDAIEQLEQPKLPKDLPLRFAVQDIFQHGSSQQIVVGKVLQGELKQGEEVVILPAEKQIIILSIEVFEQQIQTAGQGACVGVTLSSYEHISRGSILSSISDAAYRTTTITGNVFWMAASPLVLGAKVMLRCSTQDIPVRVTQLEQRMDSSSLELIEARPTELQQYDVGRLSFAADKSCVCESFHNSPELGRFVIEADFQLQGAGIVL